MKNKYKNLPGTIKLWCFTKWDSCNVICSEKSSIDTADVIALVDNYRIGFIITVDKTTKSIKRQITNCKNSCKKVYLVVSETNFADMPKRENDLCILNISDKYGLGNIIEELYYPIFYHPYSDSTASIETLYKS